MLDARGWLKHRWLGKLDGKRVRAGRWDFEIIVADRLGWTPDELYALDPSFVDELQVYLEADAQHSREELGKLRDRDR